jgi:hypothetical protein
MNEVYILSTLDNIRWIRPEWMLEHLLNSSFYICRGPKERNISTIHTHTHTHIYVYIKQSIVHKNFFTIDSTGGNSSLEKLNIIRRVVSVRTLSSVCALLTFDCLSRLAFAVLNFLIRILVTWLRANFRCERVILPSLNLQSWNEFGSRSLVNIHVLLK